MHIWGDKWFKENGKDLYTAIEWIENRLHKYGIAVYGKEKWGAYRDEYLRLWDGSLYNIFYKNRMYIGPSKHSKYKWVNDLRQKFHYWLYWRVDRGYTWKMMRSKDNFESGRLKRFIDKELERGYKHGFIGLMERTGILKRVQDWQVDKYNMVFQEACKKWPNIIDELIADIDGYKMIKPGKYGLIDGEEIHKKYWIDMNEQNKEE